MAVTINGTTGISTPGLSNSSTTTNTGNVTNSGTVTNASTISVGNATPAASGAGITFPATQSASSDANTLDDYEEGTWTPTDASGAGLSLTASGTYEKIGRLVIARGIINIPSTANTASARFAGLPFTSNGTNTGNGGFVTYTTQGSSYSLYVEGVTLFPYNTSGNTINNAAFSLKQIQFTCVYYV